MPKFDMLQESATVLRWLCREGDQVAQGDPLLEVETDKVVMEVEAPATGLLGGIRAQAGAVVPVTTVIAFVLQAGEPLPNDQPVVQSPLAVPAQQARRATPVARRYAAQAGIDILAIPATQPAGRVMRQDVERYLAQRVTAQPESPSDAGRPRATPAARRLARQQRLDLAQIAGSGPHRRVQAADVRNATHAPAPQLGEPAIREVVPLQGVRQVIARRMQQSYQTAPHFTLSLDVDMSNALALRDELNARVASQPRVSITALLVHICGAVLQRHRWLNAALRDDTIQLYEPSNIGVAVAADAGLIVPVIKQVERLALTEVAACLNELTVRAQQGRLTLNDTSGGTFTISNLGMYGIDHFTAIINPPQSAILAVGRIAKRAIVVERAAQDEIVIRPMMNMTLSVDHRVLDGATAARFLHDLAIALEQPGEQMG
jgi:pyruvate dehydrogenase E2 component (dihydrolipoyllysine-residue acetyltransferase)